MTDNRLPARWPTHAGWTEAGIARATAEVAAATGFVAGVELQRRFLYDRDKTYRVRIEGTLTALPFAFIGSVPSRALLHGLSLREYALVAAVLGTFIAVDRALWRAGLRRYQSASS
jgi:hypothetical protein